MVLTNKFLRFYTFNNENIKSYMMTKNIFSLVLLVALTIALSSCSKGFGCYSSFSEVKESTSLIEHQLNDITAEEELTSIKMETTLVAD